MIETRLTRRKATRRSRAATAPRRKWVRLQQPTQWPDGAAALNALARAWSVTTVALALLLGAVVLAPAWHGSLFMEALRQSLSRDPELILPPEAPADASGSPWTG